jgi:hypothetical protein
MSLMIRRVSITGDGGEATEGAGGSGIGDGAVDPGSSLPPTSIPQPLRYALALTVAFAAVGLAAVSRHEMWGDELQAWLIATHSESLGELFRALRYEGHPPLWYLLLYGVSRATSSFAAMRVLHVAVAAAAVFVFARYAPFSRLQKCLFAFGYFPFYEYGVICRNYGLGLLALFGFCAAFRPGPHKNYLRLAVLLALLVQTNVYAVMIAAALVAGMFHEIGGFRGLGRFFGERRAERLAAVALLAASVVTVLVVMFPPDDRTAFDWREHDEPAGLAIALSVPWNGYVPLPAFSSQFWNTNVVPTGWTTAALGMAFVAASILCLARKRTALVVYATGAAATTAFTFFLYYGNTRHHGHLFVLFVASLWLAARLPEEAAWPPALDALARRARDWSGRVFTALLVVHVAAAVVAVVVDWRRPFSNAERVAAFVRAARAGDQLVAGDIDNAAIGVSAFLGEDVYHPRSDRMGSFVVWDNRRLELDAPTLLGKVRAKAHERGEDVIYVVNYPLEDPSVEKIAEFSGAIEGYEDFFVYVVRSGG